MIKHTKALIFINVLFFGLVLSTNLFAATEFKATLDRNPVMENESFILQLQVNDSVDSDELDLSPLFKSGLVVGRSNTSSQTQIINGSISKTTTWSVVLLAREAGNYRIPSLSLDGVFTQPLTVQVVKSNAQAGQQNQPIFLKNSIETSELYLQQTTKLVTRLYFAPNVDLQSGTLTDPVLDAAFIKQQGNDNETSEIIMGVRYRVIERIYTVTPQSSGEFTIASPTFNGEISTDRRRSMFSNFGSRKPVSSIGNDISINVSPIPDNYSGNWLPSELVQLNDEWQPEQQTYEVGEPITRTFTLTALNVNEEQLPELKGTYPSEFNVYPDQSEAHSAVRQNAVVSQRVSSEAIVATKVGTFTLPEVALTWFNTKTNRQEKAVIPAKTIEIVATESQQQDTLLSNIPLQQQIIDDSVNNCPISPEQQICEKIELENNIHWLITLSGWIVWLLTTIFLVFKIKKLQKNKSQKQQANEVVPDSFERKKLKAACKNNQANEVRAELIKWAKENIDKNITTLQQVSNHVDAATQEQIELLNQSQYASNKSNWQGSLLWQALEQFEKTVNKKTENNSDLPPLN